MTAASRAREADAPVAIIGMAARAAGSPDLDALWRLVASGQDAITDIPADRLPGFDAERLGVAPPRAALLDRIDVFDAEFFGVSPRQAAYLDPRQRLLLEETWHALEDAAIPPSRLAGSDTGVFVGSMGADFRLRCDGLGAFDQYTASGTMDAFLANRISYQFDLRGCSMHVDTASSAGLTAVVQAVCALSVGQVSMAIAAGANVICHGFDQEAYIKAGILSPSGRSRPFSEEANGYVRGDGVAVVILKRLEDAERDGDPVRAVIRGVAQGHDGRIGGQFSPSSELQAELIRRATARAGVTPGALGYIEAHATGTRLGDAAEATGLIRALDGESAVAGPDDRLWVGALKPVIGHTEGAAGVFGLVKAVLVLENERIPAIPAFTRPAAHIGVDGSPLGFPASSVPWPRTPGRPRLAGVSSFGLGGADAHVVLSDVQPPPAAAANGNPGSRIFPVSAATPGALARLAAHFAGWLRNHPAADLASAAWTLQAGRSALPCRAVLSGARPTEVAAAAAELARGSDPVSAGTLAADPVGQAMAAAFLAGQEADWAALWDGRTGPPKTRLMPYPFEARSHWPRAEQAPEALLGKPAESPARPEQAHREDQNGSEDAPAPATDAAVLEQLISAAVAEVLYLEPGTITPEQDFVAAGLDSVLAVEFVQLLRSRSGLDLTVAQIYATPTIRTLARNLAGGRVSDPSPATASERAAEPPRSAPGDLAQRLRELASECLYLPPENVDPDAELTGIGLDSVIAMEFVAKLNSSCGTDLTLSAFYQQTTLNELAAALAESTAQLSGERR